MQNQDGLFDELILPCGVVLKNRIAKSAMSDSLGDGKGHPTTAQNRLYQRWAQGGLAVAIVGEVQPTSDHAEKPGNLVLDSNADLQRFDSIQNSSSARLVRNSAKLAQKAGFGGVQIHAAHGFLLSQFLSPLFNKRDDEYGGPITNRMKLLIETIEAVRAAVGPHFPIAVKLNSSDQLKGGLEENDALEVVAALDKTSIDLIDISGGTYFPGAKSASDSAGSGPYFTAFAKRARVQTSKPLMLTGGFKTRAQAEDALSSGLADIIGLARALALEPSLPNLWMENKMPEPAFPRFADAPEGGITAWYTMRLTEIGDDAETSKVGGLAKAVQDYEARDAIRTEIWANHFEL